MRKMRMRMTQPLPSQPTKSGRSCAERGQVQDAARTINHLQGGTFVVLMLR